MGILVLNKEKGEKIMKKKIMAVIAALVLISLFSACQSSPQQTSSEPEKEESREISQEDAKRIAFEDAKVTSEKEIADFSIEKDQEDMQKVYEVKFILLENNWEYEYEILAQDGKILSKDVEETLLDPQVQVSIEEAKKAVLERVKGAKEENIKIELEEEDGMYLYEGEIVDQNIEYEFKMDADTGMMIEWSEEKQ